MEEIIPDETHDSQDNKTPTSGAARKVAETMLPPACTEPAAYPPASLGTPPVPKFEPKVLAVTDATRTQLEERGFKPNALPENTVIYCTRIDFLLRKPLPSTLPPLIRLRWRDNLVHPREMPLLRRAMAVTGITFLGDIPEMDEQQLHRTLKTYGFDDMTMESVRDFFMFIQKTLGVTFGKSISQSENRQFQMVKDLFTEEYDVVPLNLLVIPINKLLEKIKTKKHRNIMEHKLEEIGCTLVGDFIELNLFDLDNCDLLDRAEKYTTILMEEIQKMDLKMGTHLSTETKKTLQKYKAEQK